MAQESQGGSQQGPVCVCPRPAVLCHKETPEGSFPLSAAVFLHCPDSFGEPLQVNNSKCDSGVSFWLSLQDVPWLFTGAKEQHHP